MCICFPFEFATVTGISCQYHPTFSQIICIRVVGAVIKSLTSLNGVVYVLIVGFYREILYIKEAFISIFSKF